MTTTPRGADKSPLFNVFRMSAAHGRVSQLLRPGDVHDLVKRCRVLDAELAADGCLPRDQRRALVELSAQLQHITRPSE